MKSNSNAKHEVRGHFLYADYTPLEDNRNVIEMLNAFVSLTAKIIKLRLANEKLQSALDDSEHLRKSTLSAINHLKASIASTIEQFTDQHSEVFASDVSGSSAAILGDTKNEMLRLLNDSETHFAKMHEKYKEKVTTDIRQNEQEAVTLIQNWLSDEHANLPYSALTSLSSDTSATLDAEKSHEQHDICRVASASLQAEIDAVRFSYVTKIESNEIEFWNRRRKVAELGIKEMMLPVGTKAPIAEKLKQTFKFGLGDSEPAKEPDFRKVDDYYIISAELQGGKTLVLQLASDMARPTSSLFKVTYDVSSLSAIQGQPGTSSTSSSEHNGPRIDYYRIDENGQQLETTDLLQIAEIEKSTDLSKIMLLGTATLSKINILTDPMTLFSRARLESLEVGGKKVVGKPNELQRIDFINLFEFLRLVASTFNLTIQKLKEKTPVQEEIIIRQELAGGQRKEFTIRLDDLRSRLTEPRYGNPISEALGADIF